MRGAGGQLYENIPGDKGPEHPCSNSAGQRLPPKDARFPQTANANRDSYTGKPKTSVVDFHEHGVVEVFHKISTE
jgi:hypothetical protein